MVEQTAEIGMSKWEIDTPALLIDLPTMENNLKKMVDFFSSRDVNLRPHVKTYKATPDLAQIQLNAGAIGITCAKLSEAEVLAQAGIPDILIANQIVGPKKIQRLVNLAKKTNIIVAVDNLKNVEALSQAVQAEQVSIGILVELNIGHNRCGVPPFEPALRLSEAVVSAPGLDYMGIMGYDGHCTLKIKEADRERVSKEANTLLVETKKFIEEAGLEVGIVSASGTFTYRFASDIPGITDIQAGTYLLMDTAFQEHGVQEFECALTVLATVSSRPSYPSDKELAIIDIGRRSISQVLGMPEVKHPIGATLFSLSQEHGRVSLEGEAKSLDIGDKIELWVRDSNGTINLFDKFYAIREGVIEAVWEIPICGQST